MLSRFLFFELSALATLGSVKRLAFLRFSGRSSLILEQYSLFLSKMNLYENH